MGCCLIDSVHRWMLIRVLNLIVFDEVGVELLFMLIMVISAMKCTFMPRLSLLMVTMTMLMSMMAMVVVVAAEQKYCVLYDALLAEVIAVCCSRYYFHLTSLVSSSKFNGPAIVTLLLLLLCVEQSAFLVSEDLASWIPYIPYHKAFLKWQDPSFSGKRTHAHKQTHTHTHTHTH